MDGHRTGPPKGAGEQNPAYRPTHHHASRWPGKTSSDVPLCGDPAAHQYPSVSSVLRPLAACPWPEHATAEPLGPERRSEATLDPLDRLCGRENVERWRLARADRRRCCEDALVDGYEPLIVLSNCCGDLQRVAQMVLRASIG